MKRYRFYLWGLFFGLLISCGSYKSGKKQYSNRLRVEAQKREAKYEPKESKSKKKKRKIRKKSSYKTLRDYIKIWIGVPYRYGGNSFSGIDCSGFVTEVYKNYYKNPFKSRRARDLYKEVTPISKRKMKEGDLVFFKIKRARIDHMGIYLGNDKFVHTSSSRGVMVSDLTSPYFKRFFYKAGRKRNRK